MPEELPNWREKKEILWGEKSSDEERRKAAEAFFKADRFSEALDFYTRSKDREGVEKVLAAAVASGDWFLFKRCRGFLKSDHKEELRILATNARAAGKHLYALRAFLALGDSAAAEQTLVEIRKTYPSSKLLVPNLEEEAGIAKEPEEPPEPDQPQKKEKGK